MGIDEVASTSKINKIRAALDNVEGIFFTHATYRHIGAFPNLFEEIKRRQIKIYATFPCIKFGIICLYEYCIEQVKMDHVPLFKISDIDEAF